jgi:UDP-N-acetylmuramoyl-tripeptide--D-alanyl-D-alanine ligase
MGANHQGEIAALSEIACPSAGLINNIGKAHLEGFGGIEGVKKGKSELYRFLQKHKGLAFVNLDSEFLGALSEGVENRIFYGSAADDARLTYQFKLVASEPFIQVQFFCQNEWFTAASQLIGAYNYPNICNAIAIGLHYGVMPQQICEGIARYLPTNNRSQLIEFRGAQLIADCYNANPSSMQLAVKNLAETTFDGQKFAVLGEMLEMGEYSKAEHSQLVQLAADSGLTHCLLVGKGYNEVETIAANMTRLNNAEDAKQWLEARDLAHSLVLIKGSRGNKLEIIFNNSNA